MRPLHSGMASPPAGVKETSDGPAMLKPGATRDAAPAPQAPPVQALAQRRSLPGM